MTRSSFWKRGAITAGIVFFSTVWGLWRDAVYPADQFDWLAFAGGVPAGLTFAVLWVGPLAGGLDAFLEWIDR